LENYGLGTGTQNEFSKISGELPAIAKSLFSPQKEIVFPARRSLTTDFRAGARNSPFTFVSVCMQFVDSACKVNPKGNRLPFATASKVI
jgi:hypothetical protein